MLVSLAICICVCVFAETKDGVQKISFIEMKMQKELYQHRNSSSFRDKVANISSFASKTVREKLMQTTVPTWTQFVRSSLSIRDQVYPFHHIMILLT